MAQRKILVVEDEAVVLQTLQLILKQFGYDVRGARDGKEAIAVAPAFQPDTLLCDINLPDIDGIQVALKLKRAIPHCRVVLLSGDIGSGELLEKAEAQGYHFDVLAKPADPEHLLRVLAGAKVAYGSAIGIHRIK